jgi:hypothetical protein
MRRHERENQCWQHEDVRDEEARDRQCTKLVAAAYKCFDPWANHREHEDVRAHRRREVRLLIPRQQVPGERHREHQYEQDASRQPQEMTLPFVGAEENRLRDVQQQHDDDGTRTVHMDAADE